MNNEEMSEHAVYGSPNLTPANDADLVKWVRSLRGKYIIIGDFNLPGIDWMNGRTDAKGREFFDECNDKFLTQHIEEATHKSGNTLDLVLTSDESLVSEVEMEGRLDHSDHEMISVRLNIGIRGKNFKFKFDYIKSTKLYIIYFKFLINTNTKLF